MNISDAEFVRRVANLARQITPLLDARAGKYALTAQEREEQELCRARFGWHDPTSPPQLAYKRSLRQKRSEVA